MKERTVSGELFGKLVAMGLRAKDVASVVRACNGSMSAHVVGAILQQSNKDSVLRQAFNAKYAIRLARRSCPSEFWVDVAAGLIRECEETCRNHPYITTTKRPKKRSSARASSAQKQQNLPSLF